MCLADASAFNLTSLGAEKFEIKVLLGFYRGENKNGDFDRRA